MEPAGIRVIVVDSSRMNSQAVSAVLKGHEFQVVYAGSDPDEAITEASRQHVDVALIGEHVHGQQGSGFELTEKIGGVNRRPFVVMILDHSDPDSVTRAFRAGARGIFCRNSSLETLPKCIHCVHQGQLWASSSELEHMLHALKVPLRLVNATGGELLSKREREVVQRVSEGLTNREIANLLSLSENTVKNYIYRIFDKLGISSRVELVLYAASQLMQQRPAECQNCQNRWDCDTEAPAMFRWCRDAVERFTVFQYLLGELYREGKGVAPDRQAAYMWFLIAEKVSTAMTQKSRDAQLDLERELTHQQIADAKREAAKWVEKKQHLSTPKAPRTKPLVA